MRESEKKKDGVQIQRVRVEVQYDCLIPYDLQVETDKNGGELIVEEKDLEEASKS